MKLSLWRPWLAAALLLVPLLVLYRWQAQRITPAAGRAAGTANGQALVLHQGAEEWQSGSQQTLFVGDSVRALDIVRLTFVEGSLVEMAPGALLIVQQAGLSDGSLALQQQAGVVSVDTLNPLFRIETTAASLSMERTRFKVEVANDGTSYVMAEQGLVKTTSNGEQIAVAAGEALRTGVEQRARLQQTTPAVMPSPPPPPPRTATPTVTPVPPTPLPVRVHVIVAGDTLTYLANLYDVTVDAIVKANNITDPNMLHIGQQLIIPKSTK